jgi:hypothetical protein
MVGVTLNGATKKDAKLLAKQDKILYWLEGIECPGYRYQLHRAGGQFFVQMLRDAEDRNGDGDVTLHHYAFACNGGEGAENFVGAVRDIITMLEIHEVAERFQYDGTRVFDPHQFLKE